jgi:HIP---CoA ligase
LLSGDNIAEAVLARAACQPSNRAILLPDGVLTYSELETNMRAAAAAIQDAGVSPGDRVAIWATNSSEWIIAALATFFIGAVLVPINTRFRASEAADILSRSQARMLMVGEPLNGFDFAKSIAGRPLPYLHKILAFGPGSVRPDVILWSNFIAGYATPDHFPLRQPSDISDILFTSGTTGQPKGVVTTHCQNLSIFRNFAKIVDYQPSDTIVLINPFFHAFGYKAGWLSGLLAGACLLPIARFEAAALAAAIASSRATILPGPPTIFSDLARLPEPQRQQLASLRSAITGAAGSTPAMIEDIAHLLGIKQIYTGYGLTECCGVATMTRTGDPLEVIAHSVGRALSGVDLICVREDGRRAKPGELGEVHIRGYNLMSEYLDNPNATREAIDGEGWLHTGDIGVIDENGNLRIVDRLKDMFISGGFNCYPAEIERVLRQHPAVLDTAVVGVADERLGEVGWAFVVVKDGLSEDIDSEIMSWCRAEMANFKVPRRLVLIDALPRNASGKVERFKLKDIATIEVSKNEDSI